MTAYLDWIKASGECITELVVSLETSSAITARNDAGNLFQSGLERLRNDKENGARVLATEAVKTLVEMEKVMETL